MAELSKIFKSNDLYEAWRDNKDIPSNVLAVVLDKTGNDVEKVAFATNDITGEYTTYEVEKAQEQPLQAVGYMFNDYIGMPMYEIGSGMDFPCEFLSISTNDSVTRYEGNIFIKYNRAMTDEEVTAEAAKITGDKIDMNDIDIRRVEGENNIVEIIWVNTDESMAADTMTIYYDGASICSFLNEFYTVYCNTGVIMMGHNVPITQNNWNQIIEGQNVLINNECATVYPITETGEYHIMLIAKNYESLNLTVEVVFNNGVDIVKQYTKTPVRSFIFNGLRAFNFNFLDVPTSSPIDNIQIFWGNATYTMNIV